MYCKDYQRKGEHQQVRLDFLGYSFKPIVFRSQIDESVKLGYDPAISKTSVKRIIEEIKSETVANNHPFSFAHFWRKFFSSSKTGSPLEL